MSQHCPAFGPGSKVCPPAICDCFIEQFPDDMEQAGALHPEFFEVVGSVVDMSDERKKRIRVIADQIIERDGEILRRLAEGDQGLVQHMVENQIEPHERARELQEQGHNVEVAMVNTSPDAEGFLVKCIGCGREARLSFDPGDKVVMCPPCQRERM